MRIFLAALFLVTGFAIDGQACSCKNCPCQANGHCGCLNENIKCKCRTGECCAAHQAAQEPTAR
jgi:hypothetical protein